jgi:pimeloyl-ACP methyl ester carboxylesterase
MGPCRVRCAGVGLSIAMLAVSCVRGTTATARPGAKFVQVDGVRLQYLDWGGAGEGLVFVHPLGLSSPHAFDDIAPLFRDRFRVIAYARRGHGRSQLKGPYDHATLVEDLHQLLDSLRIARVILVGWALGSDEIIEFATTYPERVAGLVCIECYDVADPGLARVIRDYPINTVPTNADLASAAAFRAWWKSVFAPNHAFTPAMEASIADAVNVRPDGSVSPVTPDTVIDAILASAATYHRQYAAIRAPILAIWGHQYRGGLIEATAPDSLQRRVDRFLRDDVRPWLDTAIARFRAATPGARVVVLDSASHGMFVFQNRDTIVAEMRRFTSSVR